MFTVRASVEVPIEINRPSRVRVVLALELPMIITSPAVALVAMLILSVPELVTPPISIVRSDRNKSSIESKGGVGAGVADDNHVSCGGVGGNVDLVGAGIGNAADINSQIG